MRQEVLQAFEDGFASFQARDREHGDDMSDEVVEELAGDLARGWLLVHPKVLLKGSERHLDKDLAGLLPLGVVLQQSFHHRRLLKIFLPRLLSHELLLWQRLFIGNLCKHAGVLIHRQVEHRSDDVKHNASPHCEL